MQQHEHTELTSEAVVTIMAALANGVMHTAIGLVSGAPGQLAAALAYGQVIDDLEGRQQEDADDGSKR